MSAASYKRTGLDLGNALASFAGQDATLVESIGRAARHARAVDVADRIACASVGAQFFVNRDDLAVLKELIAFMEGELDMAGFLAPERCKPDAVYRDPNCERHELTGEVV